MRKKRAKSVSNLKFDTRFFVETEPERECPFFTGLDHNQTTLVVQGVGLGGHGLDSDACTGGRRVNLDGVVLFCACLLPDVQGADLALEENMRLATVVRGSMEDFGYLYNLTDADAIYALVRRFCSTLILTDGARTIRVYTPEGCATYPVKPIETVSTVGAGDNFNAGYIYAIRNGIDDPAARIAMAQRWSQDVCRQLGNNISDELVTQLRSHC